MPANKSLAVLQYIQIEFKNVMRLKNLSAVPNASIFYESIKGGSPSSRHQDFLDRRNQSFTHSQNNAN